MELKTWFEGPNGNCVGQVSFELRVDGHTQVFRATEVVVNRGYDLNFLKTACLQGLLTRRLPYLFKELQRAVERGTGVDQEHKIFKFKQHEWEVR